MRFLVLSLLCASLACTRPATRAPETRAPTQPADPSSYAQPEQVQVRHLSLALTADFEHRSLSGSATLDLTWSDTHADTLVLDTRDLTIQEVSGDDGKGFVPLPFTLAPRDPVFGQKLSIRSTPRVTRVRIRYATSPDASGLQWLTPAMTAGGKQPFMFSQSQAIHARSWVPLQDTPRVRFTYDAELRTPSGLVALMSAQRDDAASASGVHRFEMPQAVPSYLLAIAVGELAFRPISERSGVWAEPSLVDAARSEFADTEQMIRTAESLYGPYRWGRYDILVLPPSFPFGGMENPRLTFATPTVIVGDRSLVSLIAHELAHSWSGNLVTNSSWKDSWLNEGFTTYVEGRIVEALYGVEAMRMDMVIGQRDLEQEFTELAPEDQVLAHAPLGQRDPDDLPGDAAYTKGQWFLSFLEGRVGRAPFDAFLRSWFDSHAFQSTDSDEFERFLTRELLDKHPGRVSAAEVHAFLREPGIPGFAEHATSERFVAVDAARTAFLAGKPASELDHAHWSTQERVRFLEGLPEQLTHAQLQDLDRTFSLTGTSNGELAMRWYPLTVHAGYVEARPQLADFLRRIGRRKLILPSYRALAETPDGQKFARAVFESARAGYHPITRASVEELVSEPKSAP
jgi:leukotriene-A4 hydrolase